MFLIDPEFWLLALRGLWPAIVVLLFIGALLGFVLGWIACELRHNREVRKMKSLIAVVLIAALCSACSPMFSGDLKETLSAAGKDNASLCARAFGGAGGFALAPAPTIPASGGYGEFVLCRSNEPGSEIEVTATSIKIKHGLAGDLKERVDTLESAVKYMLQKMITKAPGTGS